MPDLVRGCPALAHFDHYVEGGYSHIIGEVGAYAVGLPYSACAVVVDVNRLVDVQAVGKDDGLGGGVDVQLFIVVYDFIDKGYGVT